MVPYVIAYVFYYVIYYEAPIIWLAPYANMTPYVIAYVIYYEAHPKKHFASGQGWLARV